MVHSKRNLVIPFVRVSIIDFNQGQKNWQAKQNKTILQNWYNTIIKIRELAREFGRVNQFVVYTN